MTTGVLNIPIFSLSTAFLRSLYKVNSESIKSNSNNLSEFYKHKDKFDCNVCSNWVYSLLLMQTKIKEDIFFTPKINPVSKKAPKYTRNAESVQVYTRSGVVIQQMFVSYNL